VRNPLLSRHLLWVPSDCDGRRQLAYHSLHHPFRLFMLLLHAFRFEERRRHLPEVHAVRLWQTHRSVG
jgi:hypothetical protein